MQPAQELAAALPDQALRPWKPKAQPEKTLSRNQRQQIQKKLAALEARIRALENESALHEAQLANPPADPKKTAHRQKTITSLEQSWNRSFLNGKNWLPPCRKTPNDHPAIFYPR